jgi:hypothetical protein
MSYDRRDTISPTDPYLDGWMPVPPSASMPSAESGSLRSGLASLSEHRKRGSVGRPADAEFCCVWLFYNSLPAISGV